MEHECGSFAVRLRVLIRAAWRRPEPARWSIGPHITGPMEHWAGWGRAVGWYASGWRQWRGEYCGTGQYRACLEGSAGPRVRSVESASDLLRSLLPRLPHGHHRLQPGRPPDDIAATPTRTRPNSCHHHVVTITLPARPTPSATANP